LPPIYNYSASAITPPGWPLRTPPDGQRGKNRRIRLASVEIGYWRYLMRLVPRIEPPVRNAQQQWGLKFADIDAALRVPPPQKARFHLVRSHGTWAHPPSLDHIFDRVLIIRYEKSMR
jgi:hypothetical protein